MTGIQHTGDGAFAAGLRGYVASVAEAVGVSVESCYVDTDEHASVYLAVDDRLADFPGRDVALLWDEERGWSVVVETASGEDLFVIAGLGTDPVALPAEVAHSLKLVVAGVRRAQSDPGHPADRCELVRRMSVYARKCDGLAGYGEW
jgi:hypothetical protein